MRSSNWLGHRSPKPGIAGSSPAASEIRTGLISDNRLAHLNEKPQWYLENLGVLTNEEEFNEFFERNYQY